MTAAIEELVQQLGTAVLLDDAALDAARVDYSGKRSDSRPLAVVEARTVDEVQTVMRWASAHRVPVVPRGAGTGLAGGSIGAGGEVVLSLARMRRILEVSALERLAVVEPGVLNAELNSALAEHGLWWAPDPASREIASVGGNIATNAGGLLCAKYGVTREAVLGLDVVTADGELLRMGHRTVKGVTGLDLTSLVIGSEGTLGVIVGATLRLLPRASGEPRSFSAWFPDVAAAATGALAITATGLTPAILELLDERSVALLRALYAESADDFPFSAGGGILIGQCDGPTAAADMSGIVDVVRRSGAEVRVASTAEEAEQIFAVRRAFHSAVLASGESLIEDVAVPRSRLAEMFARIREIEAEFGVEIPTVAHAADGNLHPNFVLPRGTTEVPEAVWAAADALFTSAISLGGTLTGEHGIGLLKRRWLRAELGDAQYLLQRRLKAAFDPLGILNPGKVFGPE